MEVRKYLEGGDHFHLDSIVLQHSYSKMLEKQK
jgi:hypothetical protein